MIRSFKNVSVNEYGEVPPNIFGRKLRTVIFSAFFLICAMMCGCTEIVIEDTPPAETVLSSVRSEDMYGTDSADAVSDTAADTETYHYYDNDDNKNSRYIYYSLSEKERKFYDELKEAAENFLPSVTYSEEIDLQTARKIFIAVYNQEPELFWLDSIFFAPSESVQPLAYRFAPDEAERMSEELETVTDGIMAGLADASDYEKIVAFHDYLVLNCTFSETDRYSGTAYGCICGGYAQCEGYAFAFKYLCSRAGINCITVTGSDTEGNSHAWNIAMLDGIWYNVDCTWDDPILDPPDTGFIRRYYLLVSNSEIIGKSHIINSEYFDYPVCYDSSRNYYSREGFMASDVSDGIAMLERSAYEALSAGLFNAEVRFDNSSAYYSASSQLFNFSDVSGVISRAASQCGMNGKINTRKYIRYLNDDLFIIHIKIISE